MIMNWTAINYRYTEQLDASTANEINSYFYIIRQLSDRIEAWN